MLVVSTPSIEGIYQDIELVGTAVGASDEATALTSRMRADLQAVASGLRSHGGRYEEMVPLLVSRPLTAEYRRKASGDPRNFDVFDFAVNGTQG